MYANVLVEYNVKSLDKVFTYIVPYILENRIKVGMQVIVPFGNKYINGFVLGLTNTKPEDVELKEITRIKNEELVLNEELIKLGYELQKMTLCSLISAYQTMLPSSLKIKDSKTHDKFDTYVVLNKPVVMIEEYISDNYKRSKKQVEVLNILLENKKILKHDLNGSAVKTLLDKDIIREEKEQVYRINNNTLVSDNTKLTNEQLEVYNKINMSSYKTYLLHGVTGSGKTEIYIKLIKETINNNKTALMLVPEITLTAQIVKRFYSVFGSDVAVFHSALSEAEKYDEYLKILRGNVHVVVGTRSSVFAPLKDLGIIIIDEEHSDSYKQENNPRYDAIEVCKIRAKYNNIPLLLGSATPTLESYARAKKGVYELIELKKRIGKSMLPMVHLVDMEPEYKKRNMIISDLLKELINTRLENQEQVILLLNRRGFSTIFTCPDCGYTYKCPHCDITLTYHKTSNNLRCHYCGYTIVKKDMCPNCKNAEMRDFGLGTEKLESIIKELFPESRIIRMDADTTTKKGSHDEIIETFHNHEYDILLGTQMIAKGLDFPLVTLVGVINADQSLNMPDFKANERTFDLLSQVSGRAGRSDRPGEVVIQTMNPTDYTLNCVKDNNYEMFYKYEMNNRKNLRFSPYYFLVSIKVISKDYDVASKDSIKVFKYLKRNLPDMEILGPTTSNVFRVNNNYRFQLIIKYRTISNLMSVLKELDNMYVLNKQVYLEIDTSPKTI